VPSHPTNVPTENPTLLPTTIRPTTVPTVTPTIAYCPNGQAYASFPYSACTDCPKGYFSNRHYTCQTCPGGTAASAAGSSACTTCPDGTYSLGTNPYSGNGTVQVGDRCKDCIWPWTTSKEGSTSCNYFCLCLSSANSGIIIAIFTVVFVICLVATGTKSLVLLTFAFFPFLDILSDALYVSETKFYNYGLFISSATFLVAPNIMFVYKMYDIGALRPVFLVPLPTTTFFWLGWERGFPTAYGKLIPHLVFEHNDSLLKLMWSALGWILVLIMQFLSFMVFVLVALPPILLHVPFYVFWLALGFFLHQTKVIAIGRVWTLWFRVWTGTRYFDLPSLIDTGIMNESLFAEFVSETLPQLVVQITNNQLMNLWTPIGIFSSLLSIFMAASGVYRFVYWRFILGVPYEDVPIELSFGPGFTVKIPKSDMSSKDHFKQNNPQSEGVAELRAKKKPLFKSLSSKVFNSVVGAGSGDDMEAGQSGDAMGRAAGPGYEGQYAACDGGQLAAINGLLHENNVKIDVLNAELKTEQQERRQLQQQVEEQQQQIQDMQHEHQQQMQHVLRELQTLRAAVDEAAFSAVEPYPAAVPEHQV